MKAVNKIILSGLFLALAVMIPQFLHPFGLAGNVFLPMHIPIILCGMICGYKWGGITGLLAPLISSVTFSMPVLYPMAVCMMLELAAYGVVSGILIKKTNVFVSLVSAMLAGRVVLGIAQAILFGISGNPLKLNAFLTGAFVTAIPGIVIQLFLVPAIIIAVKQYYKYKSHG